MNVHACIRVCWTALVAAISPADMSPAEFCPQPGVTLSTTDAAQGDAPFAVRCCDINGDGRPDLVTANDASDTISVLINNGNGTYAPKVRWPVDIDQQALSEPVDVVCCDVNGDLLVDLVAVNHTSDDVSVLLNIGDALFAPAVKYPVGEAPFGIECLDLDGDTDNDLITNGFTEDAISVLLNNGLGVFAPHVTYGTGDAPIAMALCDVDGDSDSDVVTANMLGKSVSVLRNNANGTFTSLGSTPICRTPASCINPFDITCCDFDGINGADVATANGIDDSVAVLFNNGSGTFGGPTFYNDLDGAYSVACCDLSGDAKADIATANLASDDLAVLINAGAGSFGSSASIPLGSTADPSSVVCCNIEGDADNDLATAHVGGVEIIENDCGGDQALPESLLPEPSGVSKNRFLSVVIPPEAAGQELAIRVELMSLAAPPAGPGTPAGRQFRYVTGFRPGGADFECSGSANFGRFYNCGRLVCSDSGMPIYRDWGDMAGETLHVTGDAVHASSEYAASLIPSSCGSAASADACAGSTPLTLNTARWGDHADAGGDPLALDGEANVIDISYAVDKVKDLAMAFPEVRIWKKDTDPDPETADVNVLDAAFTVDAVKNLPYPESFVITVCP